MKRLLPLLFLPVVALADFPGAVIPGTPGSNLDRLPCPSNGGFSTGNGYGNVRYAEDWFLAFDGETGTFPNTDGGNKLTLDAGTPRTLSGIRAMIWEDANKYQSAAFSRFSVWGSADGGTWTEIAGQNGTQMPAGQWVEYTPASSGPFRYFEFRSCPMCWAKEIELYSEDLMVESKRPEPWATTAPGSADRPAGVLFSGTLTRAPEGSAEVVVYVDAKDWGDDAAAWAAHGTSHSAGTVASGATWSVDIPLGRGLWHARAFALSGGTASASQRTESFVAGGTACFPPAFVSYGDSGKERYQYDGDASSHGDGAASWIVLDVRNLANAAGKELRPASVKIWAGLNAQVPFLAWLWSRGAVVEASWDDATWSGTRLSSVTARTVSNASEPAGLSWTRVADATGNLERMSVVYEIALPDSFLRRPPNFLRLSNVPLSYLAEIEVRGLVPDDATVIVVK